MKFKSLEEIINEEFTYLFSGYKFQKIGYVYAAQLMGNEGYDISNGRTMISFIKDREQLLVFFGHPGLSRPKWYTLSLILYAKNITNIEPYKFSDEKGNGLSIEYQSRYVSPIIRDYCQDILSGKWDLEGILVIKGKQRAEEVIKELMEKGKSSILKRKNK